VRAPFRIVRPFVPDDGSALLQYGHVGPGLIGGDVYALDVTVEPGAHAILVAASATRLHRMAPGASAVQRVRCTLMDGGALEYYPGLTIPFPQTEFVQTVTVTGGPTAKFGMLETWAMGRVERGEYLAFRRLSSRTTGAPRRRAVLPRRGRAGVRARRVRVGGPRGAPIPRGGLLALARGAAPRRHRGPRPAARQRRAAARRLLSARARQDGLRLRAALSATLGRQRAAWGLAPIAFGPYTGTVDPPAPPVLHPQRPRHG